MYKDELEWELPYFDGYTGPYYSDGKLQASVAHGKRVPKSKLARYSRDHDTSYNLCRDNSCLNAADELYRERTSTMSFFPRIIGKLPQLWYGRRGQKNKNMRFRVDYATDFGDRNQIFGGNDALDNLVEYAPVQDYVRSEPITIPVPTNKPAAAPTMKETPTPSSTMPLSSKSLKFHSSNGRYTGSQMESSSLMKMLLGMRPPPFRRSRRRRKIYIE